MHELSIAQAIVDQARDVLEKEGGAAIRRVALTLGVLSGVEEHALREAFPIACEGTPANGADLEIEIEQASVYCNDCQSEVVVTPPFMVCGKCMGGNVDFRRGRDMIIRQIEIGD
jgi:hydrogenase nickel incorporation protein HypA/HybF